MREYTLKSLRESRGLTQGQLAYKSGIDLRRVQRLEKGEIKVENLTLKRAVGVCKALGVTPEELLKMGENHE